MVSADNINYDVLTLIFAFLDKTDLVSVCLVSRSFQIGATQWLYRSICFGMEHKNRWPRVTSPFTTIIAHPRLGAYVRYFHVKAVPKLKGEIHPEFIASCAASLALCPSLISFTCASDSPTLIPLLPSKTGLIALKIHAALSAKQTSALSSIRGLHTLSLYDASWNVCDTLSQWIPTFASTLASLKLANSPYLNETVLGALLPHLSAIRSLHVVGCSQVSHGAILRLASHIPMLESLSMSTWETAPTPFMNCSTSLLNLRHFSLDTRWTFPELYSYIFPTLTLCPLKSLTVKLHERMVIDDTFLERVLDDHCETLARLNAINASLTYESLASICTRCEYLEQLAVTIPVKEMDVFSVCLGYARNLHTLVDLGEPHTLHGPRASLSAHRVGELFHSVPALCRVISGNRCWTCERKPRLAPDSKRGLAHSNDHSLGYEIKLKLQRLRQSGRAVCQKQDEVCYV